MSLKHAKQTRYCLWTYTYMYVLYNDKEQIQDEDPLWTMREVMGTRGGMWARH